MKNPDTDTEHRTIGNGVVIAHATTSALTAALVVLTDLSPWVAIGAFLGLFAAVFVGDHYMQRLDMGIGVPPRPVDPDDDDDADDRRRVPVSTDADAMGGD